MKAYYFIAVPLQDGIPIVPVVVKMCDGKRMAQHIAISLKNKHGVSFAVLEYVCTINK